MDASNRILDNKDENSPLLARPIANIHWMNALKRYGFQDLDSFKEKWSRHCYSNLEFCLRMDDKSFRIHDISKSKFHTIHFSQSVKLLTLFKEKYVFNNPSFCVKNQIVAFTMMTRPHLGNRIKKFSIICVDLLDESIISCLEVKSSDGRDYINNVYLWALDMSKDDRFVALCIGIQKRESYAADNSENFVSIYDKKFNCELRRIWNWDDSLCSVAFDPSWENLLLSFVGTFQGSDPNVLSLCVYNVYNNTPIKSVSVEQFVNREEDFYFNLEYSKDGALIFFQIIEDVAYAREFACKTYLFCSDTLQCLQVCQKTSLLSCHTNCIQVNEPVLSCCNSYFALGNSVATFEGNKTVYVTEIEVYKLPYVLDLKNLCRAVILRHMSNIDDICQLKFPPKISNYLMWDFPKKAIDDNTALHIDLEAAYPKSTYSLSSLCNNAIAVH